MTVTVPLGFRISWYSASPFSRVSQDTTLGGFPLAEVQVATRTLSSCPFLARSTAWVPSIQLVGLAAGNQKAHGTGSTSLSETPGPGEYVPAAPPSGCSGQPPSQLCFPRAPPSTSHRNFCTSNLRCSCSTICITFCQAEAFMASWRAQGKWLKTFFPLLPGHPQSAPRWGSNLNTNPQLCAQLRSRPQSPDYCGQPCWKHHDWSLGSRPTHGGRLGPVRPTKDGRAPRPQTSHKQGARGQAGLPITVRLSWLSRLPAGKVANSQM